MASYLLLVSAVFSYYLLFAASCCYFQLLTPTFCILKKVMLYFRSSSNGTPSPTVPLIVRCRKRCRKKQDDRNSISLYKLSLPTRGGGTYRLENYK
jgi:hypothetical protein